MALQTVFVLVSCILLLIITQCDEIQAANVLAVLPSVWKSHHLFGQRLLRQLASQPNNNHSVTLISPHADELAGVAHIREIRVDGLLENWLQMGMSFDVEQLRQQSVLGHLPNLVYAGTTNVDLLLANTQVRKLLRSGEQFDLLVVDLYLSEALLGLALYYRVPTVVLSPNGANTWLNEMFGNPQNSALDPSSFLAYTENMDFWQRSINTLMSAFEKLTYNFFHVISQQAIYEKHFLALCHRNDNSEFVLPHHRQLTRNLSLVLMNSNAVLQYPRAYLPNMLEIAGAHFQTTEDHHLPNHLRSFIEDASMGVVYMSLGANLRTIDMSAEKLHTFLDLFSHLSQMRFLLKWELPNLASDRLPINVFTNEWFPQEAILAHPNVKAFISTCGPMSVAEAIHSATPLLALPVQTEQQVMAMRLKARGVAYVVSYDNIAYDALLHGLQQLVQNNSYVDNMVVMRELLHADSVTPIKKALHYIDITLRTGGSGHLKSHATHMNFVRTELLDVLAFLAVGAFIILGVPFFVIRFILRRTNSYQQVTVVRSCIGGGDECPAKRRRSSSLTVTNRSSGTSVSSSTTSSNTTTPRIPGTPIISRTAMSKDKRYMLTRQETQ